MTNAAPKIVPFSLKNTPALIERLLPVQKLSAEAYKEQMAVHGKTLTALGSYWKGRKPLILNKACILGCLLPATDDAGRDLEIFEKLMGMDDESFAARWKRRPRPKEILGTLSIARIKDYFVVEPEDGLPDSAPVDWPNPDYAKVEIAWLDESLERDEIEKANGENAPASLVPHPSSLTTRRRLEARMLPRAPYRERVDQVRRPEEVMDSVHDHVWDAVNAHLSTSAESFPELVEQLGIMRFGHRPRVADTFCGSGQIPFEAARLGCDVFASDLNPVACMLTWGALNIVGGSRESRKQLEREQEELVRRVQGQIDELGVETDGNGWRAKVFLYCVETRCPQTGWSVPLLPSRVVSKGYRVIAELVPDPANKRYAIKIRLGVTDAALKAAQKGTIGREGKYGEAYLTHRVAGVDYVGQHNDIYITDPPYGDAVKYEEILDFFVSWLRRNPPPEFSDWTWDSRRSLAIQGEDEDFRREMVAAYRRMGECMPDNGIQVIMFTHQSGAIWADMANIVWASGLQVTAAWYVVTETDSALRAGSHVKGTVLLVVRKRAGTHKTTRDDLAWEIQDEVKEQVDALAGLNQQAKGLYRDESVFEDADIQMAGYAAALRVLTRYAVIDGRDMTAEAIRPRVKGETTFVDGLIAFAVDTANQCLVPQGLPKAHWDKLTPAERFYLKMLDLEARGAKTLDNYQNFAKAFKVRDYHALMGDQRANHARLKSAVELGRAEMSEGSELYQSVLRAVLYAVMELVKDVDSSEVLAHLTLNIRDYYGDMTRHDLAVELADYLAKRLEDLRPEEASAARVLRELVRNRRVG